MILLNYSFLKDESSGFARQAHVAHLNTWTCVHRKEKGHLVLRGRCLECGAEVAQLVEVE